MQSSFSFRPGNLKRGMTSLVDESTMKRSRTSSISSVSGIHAPKGTPGTARNPIHSSYSSSGGISQVKLRVLKLCSAALAETRKPHCFIPLQLRKRTAPSPSLSSPGSPRSQTPEAVSKKSRSINGFHGSDKLSLRTTNTPFNTWFCSQGGRRSISQLILTCEGRPGILWKYTSNL